MTASIDTSYVRRELRAMVAVSNAVRQRLRKALERIEADPSQFEELHDVPPRIRATYPGLVMRKVKIESRRHNYRLVLAHWTLADGKEHVDVLYAFRRQAGYPIDWDDVDELLGR
jgi:hypothetical protein